MKMDRKDWNLEHLGQGKTQLTKETVSNMREALERLRLRAPELPPRVEALWEHFVANFPAWLWKNERAPPIKFLDSLKGVQEALGGHYQPNPLKPDKRRKIDHGDPAAFSNWVQQVMNEYGIGRLRL